MRLLRCDDFSFVEFPGKQVPRYAILSHTWGDDEILYNDILDGSWTNKRKAVAKIKGCVRYAKQMELDYIWVDTCCKFFADP
jgi:hypothetical protein